MHSSLDQASGASTPPVRLHGHPTLRGYFVCENRAESLVLLTCRSDGGGAACETCSCFDSVASGRKSLIPDREHAPDYQASIEPELRRPAPVSS